MGAADIGAFESRGFSIAVTSGNNQSAAVNSPFAAPLVVTVTSAFGEPTQGGVVTFCRTYSGASATFPLAMEHVDASGQASVPITANTVAGSYNVMASASGATPVSFSLTNTAAVSTSTFDALAGPTITYGTATTTLSGHIAAGTHIPTGNEAITLNSVTQSAAIDPSSGNFSSVFTTSGLGVSSSPYAITYSYAGDGNSTQLAPRRP